MSLSLTVSEDSSAVRTPAVAGRAARGTASSPRAARLGTSVERHRTCVLHASETSRGKFARPPQIETITFALVNMGEPNKAFEISGSVMDGVVEKGSVAESPKKTPTEYIVYPTRWAVLFIFVFYSASNSFQWIQYSIIQDAVVKYYGVSSITVYWTSMIYMITYIPLIFPASWLLDKTVSL
ncbi:Feline leukemia virus subgroup C receptor-related protein 1 [Eumeta japonica]|uniref:Feline leukemia virus subgroup C receptor-related protein 1 n=1 Tax=Eumeta variegata TaxID=151549 RepID=A0A4C1TDJ6_EUMVA|nr:Feline leukemia virus subgroup C receptor-related protein 1 [Eumeta japonica]